MKLLITLIIVVLFSQILFPQDIKYVRGKVVYKLENNVEAPQVGVTVFIEETGDRDKTDQDGMFKIFLNKEYKPGEGITFRIEKKNWAIRDPLFGKTYVPSVAKTELITLNILPQGSPLFFTNPQITRYIEYFVLKNNSEKEGSIVNYSNLSLEALLDTMAYSWGFKTSDIKSSIQKWVDKSLRDTIDLRARGLAEYTRKNFILAGEIFNRSAENQIHKFSVIDENFIELSKERLTIIKEVIKDLKLAAESYYEIKKYDSSLVAYKNSIKFLEHTNDWEQLASTLNKIGICYYYLSYESNALQFFENLDSALIYFDKGMVLSKERSLEEWGWKFKGNIATVLAEKEKYSNNPNKVATILKLKTILNEVEKARRHDLNSKDRFMSLNNRGVCFWNLFEYSFRLDDAIRYLDTAIISYNVVNADSTIKANYPIEWAYINSNLAGILIEKIKYNYKIPSIFQSLVYEILKITNNEIEGGIINRSYSENNLFSNSLTEISKLYKGAETVFLREGKFNELTSVKNGLTYINIQNIFLFPELSNKEYIDSSYSIAKLNLLNAGKNHYVQGEIECWLYQIIFEVIISLKNRKDIDETVNNQIQLLEEKLTKEPILEFNIASIKRVLLTLYFYKYLSNKENEKAFSIIEHVKELNNDIITTFENLSYQREREDGIKLKEMINSIE